jgi:hypothetical protein
MSGTATIPFSAVAATVQGYDGTNWSTKASMSTARTYLSGMGTGSLAQHSELEVDQLTQMQQKNGQRVGQHHRQQLLQP